MEDPVPGALQRSLTAGPGDLRRSNQPLSRSPSYHQHQVSFRHNFSVASERIRELLIRLKSLQQMTTRISREVELLEKDSILRGKKFFNLIR